MAYWIMKDNGQLITSFLGPIRLPDVASQTLAGLNEGALPGIRYVLMEEINVSQGRPPVPERSEDKEGDGAAGPLPLAQH